MHRTRRAGALAGAAVLAAAVAGCASMRTGSFAEPGVDLARYRTFAWGPDREQATGDPRLDSNPFFRDRVRAQVERHLAARGFDKAAAGPADLEVHYHASVHQRIDVDRIDRAYGYRDPGEQQADVYDAGTLVLDLVDSRTRTLVWRGWAEDSVEGAIDNQEWMEQKIDEAVSRILARLRPVR